MGHGAYQGSYGGDEMRTLIYSLKKGPVEEEPTFTKKLADELVSLLSLRIETLISTGTAFNAINIISAQFPNLYQVAMRTSVDAIIPTVAIIDAIALVLEQQNTKKLHAAQRLWAAARNDLRLASFLLPLFFSTLADILKAIHHTDSVPLKFDNLTIAAVVSSCFLLSTLEGIKTYIPPKEKPTAFPHYSPLLWPRVEEARITRFLRFLTHNALARRALASLDGMSAVHWFILAIEGFAPIHQSPIERIVRYTISGVSGLLTAYALGDAHPTDNRLFRPVNILLKLIKASSLLMSTYLAFTQENAKEFWGEKTLKEQFIFWVIVFPAYLIGLKLLMAIIKKGVAWCLNKDTKTIEPPQRNFRPVKDEIPTLDMFDPDALVQDNPHQPLIWGHMQGPELKQKPLSPDEEINPLPSLNRLL